ncbi:MAG: hypothetical protein GF308_17420 [Candidatus Heimdallarchaeota archaeon]|nr:hypothetical protein [Candidatus Heimdallarchaeota archaeon]
MFSLSLKPTRRTNYFGFILIFSTLLGSLFATPMIARAQQDDFFFKVQILCINDPNTISVANLLSQELRKLRIDSQIVSPPEAEFAAHVTSRAFDIVFIEFNWPKLDPDPTIVFSENGSRNYWGIRKEMMGGELNEQLITLGKETIPFNERQEVYFEWQDHFLENLLPAIPLYNTVDAYASWETLSGWDHDRGIIASLPYMEWSAPHPGQTNQSQFIDYSEEWVTLNPLFVSDQFVPSLFAEPLLRTDVNLNTYPVLAKSWSFSENNTVLRFTLRENVTWAPDPDELYIGESFGVDDVIFSVLLWQKISTIGSFYNWIESIDKINNTVMDIYIDSNPSKPGRQPYAPALASFSRLILPEHYLNKSVDEEGLPDTNHENWQIYGNLGLGTGMYNWEESSEVDCVFTRNPDWWGITQEPFKEDLDMLSYQIRFITDQETKRVEFEGGNIDILRDWRDPYTQFLTSPYNYKERSSPKMAFLGFNLQSVECPELGDERLCEDGTMTKGLAVRKAIAHLTDKDVITDFVAGKQEKTDTPFSNVFSPYINQNAPEYDYDIEEAKGFMLKAGFDPATMTTDGFYPTLFFGSLLVVAVLVLKIPPKKH